MKTEKEIIESMLDLKERIVLAKRDKSAEELFSNIYYQKLLAKLHALKFVLSAEDVIA